MGYAIVSYRVWKCHSIANGADRRAGLTRVLHQGIMLELPGRNWLGITALEAEGISVVIIHWTERSKLIPFEHT